VKLLEENRGNNSRHWHEQLFFFYQNPKAQATKAKIDKWEYIKLKLLHSKENNSEEMTYNLEENICKLFI
jgi:predicted AAA+ superfamily ATPase